LALLDVFGHAAGGNDVNLASVNGSRAPVQLREVTKRYGAIAAVADLSFELLPGTITGFLGPNGAGKTTTLRMVGGLLRPSAGSVQVFGADARDPSARRSLGYMPADPTFLPHLSGRANLDLLTKLHGRDPGAREPVASALSLPSADLDRPVGGYSSGMRQKLAIVAALQHRPRLIILDEPANRLDPIAHHVFTDLVRGAAADGATVFLSSHVLAEVEAVCDAVLLVREGRLLTSARVEELREHAPRTVTLTYLDGRTSVQHVAADQPEQLRTLLADPSVADMTVVPASLEDIVLALYTKQTTP
jgi:ABC-2 type transport system ATP-binding protein